MRYALVCSLLVATLLPVHAQKPADPANERFLAESLDELVAGKRLLDTVGLGVKWTDSRKESSITIHGDGLGIHWQGKQFQLSAEQRLALLRKLKAAKFLAMPPLLGKLPKGAEPPWEQPWGRGSISLRIGKEAKVVEHDSEGPVNEEFVRLAKDLLTTCIKHSAAGVGVDSLADGLQKVLDHKVDVRAMRITVSRLHSPASDWLEIEGHAAKVSGLDRRLNSFNGQKSLTAEELTTFIKKLQGEKFHELPRYVRPKWSDILYIKVRVLDKEHSTGGKSSGSKYSPAEQVLRFEAVWNATKALQPPHNYDKKKKR